MALPWKLITTSPSRCRASRASRREKSPSRLVLLSHATPRHAAAVVVVVVVVVVNHEIGVELDVKGVAVVDRRSGRKGVLEPLYPVSSRQAGRCSWLLLVLWWGAVAC